MTLPPVLIVGAGPTGLTAAMELSRFGVPVRLIERLAERSTTSRALAVQARTLELLDQRGPARSMLASGNPATGMTLHGTRSVLGRLSFSTIPSRYDFILLLSQAETERALEEQVVRQGVTVERGTELLGYVDDGDAVTARLRRPDGTVETLAASYLISAEGSHSLVRKTARLEFNGATLNQRYALGDLTIDGDLPETDLSIFIGPRGFLAVFPLGAHRFRLVSTDPDTHSDLDPTLEELQRLFDEVSHVPATLHDLEWSSRFAINSRHLDSLRVGRVFLGGDAAHIHSPAGGQGMNTGIQDMINLCWKLAAVYRGSAQPQILDTYESERLPIISRIVATTERSTRLLNSRNRVVQALISAVAKRALGTRRVQTTAPRSLSETAANYRGSALSSGGSGFSGSLRAGDRLPDTDQLVTVAQESDTPRRLYDLLDASRFTLLFVGCSDDDALVGRHRDEVRLVRLAQPAGELGRVLGRQSMILVRPDAYAGVVASQSDRSAIDGWFRRWLR